MDAALVLIGLTAAGTSLALSLTILRDLRDNRQLIQRRLAMFAGPR